MAKLGELISAYHRILLGWALLALFYIMLSGSIDFIALVAAAICAGASVAITLPLLRSGPEIGRLAFSPRAFSPRFNARIARSVWRDSITIARASLLALREVATRREPNATRREPNAGRREPNSGVFRERHLASHTRPDLVALVLSLAPNSYVVDIRREDERVVFHHLIAPADDDPSREAWPP